MESVNPSTHQTTAASDEAAGGDNDEPPQALWGHHAFEDDEAEPLRSPVEVMTAYAHNSMRRLRAAIIGKVRFWTHERQGTEFCWSL
jgi:hypothetical protein